MEYTETGGEENCPLPALPPELRNTMYEYLLTNEPAEGGAVTISRTATARPRRPSVLSVLQTCRQVRDEAQAIFYHENHLRICYDIPEPVNVTT